MPSPATLYVSYLRISGGRGQTLDGHGIGRQRDAVDGYLRAYGGRLLAQYSEAESGADNDRPQLAAALAHCRRTGAILLVDQLDRLGRDARFVLGVMDGITVRSTDNPHGDALTAAIKAVLAEEERRVIRYRTRAALAAAKAKGVKLGGWRGDDTRKQQLQPERARAGRTARADAYAQDRGPLIEALQGEGLSLRGIAARLTSDGVTTPSGRGGWTANTVRVALLRYQSLRVAA